MVKLTKADVETLRACDDWKAAYEVVQIRGLKSTPANHRNVLKRIYQLCGKGLLKYGSPNATYRITDAGRVALERSEG